MSVTLSDLAPRSVAGVTLHPAAFSRHPVEGKTTMRHLLLLLLLSTTAAACGPTYSQPCDPMTGCPGPGGGDPGGDGPPPLAPVAVAINGGFETWSSLNPPGCQASWMDTYTSWCSATMPPDGWNIRTGPAWNGLLTRSWETANGVASPSNVMHALSVRGGCVPPYSQTHCAHQEVAGPTLGVTAGEQFTLAFSLYRRAGGVWTADGDPNRVSLRLEWMDLTCAERLSFAELPAPASTTFWTWHRVGPATFTAPSGARCARVVLVVDPTSGGPILDSLELMRL